MVLLRGVRLRKGHEEVQPFRELAGVDDDLVEMVGLSFQNGLDVPPLLLLLLLTDCLVPIPFPHIMSQALLLQPHYY